MKSDFINPGPSLRGIDFLAGHSEMTSYQMYKAHYHDLYEIYYLISGERNFLIGNKTYRVVPGDLVFIRPNEVHRSMNTSVQYHERMVVHFNKKFLSEAGALLDDEHSPYISQTPIISAPMPARNRIKELMHRMIQENSGRDIGYEFNIKSAIYELLVLSIRLNRDAINKPSAYNTPAHQKISSMIQFIDEHYDRPLTLSSLAQQFHYSPFYLSRLFKQTTGFTFSEYVTLVRIKGAQKLLRETKWKVSMIAEKVGFHDLSHFGKTFKRISNCTPLQYRKFYKQK